MSRKNLSDRIVVDLEVMTGKPIIRGLIIIVEQILSAYRDRLLNHFCVFQNGKLRIKKYR